MCVKSLVFFLFPHFQLPGPSMRLLGRLALVIMLEALPFYSVFDLNEACTDCPEACSNTSCSSSGSASLSYYISESYTESYYSCPWYVCLRYRLR